MRPVSVGAAMAVALLAAPASAWAQAWAPPARVGDVSVFMQVIDNTGHRLDDATEIPDGKSRNVGLAVQVGYALTDRWSISAGIPFVLSAFRGPNAPPPFIPYLPVDSCRCWSGAFQDVNAAARFSAFDRRRPYAVSPSIAVIVPSHPYAYKGEAVPGRRLAELQLGVDAGVRLDALTPRLAMTGGYTYGLVGRVIRIPNNRSLLRAEAQFAVSRRLSARGGVVTQRTHGGLRFPQEVIGDQERIDEHDRLLRDNYAHLVAGASYAWTRVEVFGEFRHFTAGVNTHMGRGWTMGVTVPFERAAPRR